MNIKNINCNNGIINMTSVDKKVTIINGVEYQWDKKLKGNSITTINDKVFVDGYELINGKWKRTLRALFHWLF